MKLRILWAACAASLIFATIGIAASTIRLKDGRTIVGEYKKLGSSYKIVEASGNTTIIPASEIKNIDGKPLDGAAGAGTVAVTPAASPTDTPTTQSAGNLSATGTTSAFKAAKAKADKAEAAIQALQVWDDFIAKNASNPDIDAAKREREAWDKIYKDNAEKIKGKWIGGKELKELKKKCDGMYNEAVDPTEEVGVRGVGGMRKLDDIIALYPHHFGANFEKGFYYLVQATRTQQGSLDLLAKGVKALEQTSEIAPTVPEVWSNLAIGYNFQKKYQASIESAFRAVKMRDDDKELLQTLSTAISNAPKNIVNVNPHVREINEEAQVLFRKYGMGGGGAWLYLRPKAGSSSDRPPEDVAEAPGVRWAGSGFFVNGDGYLITNHHVAAKEPNAPEVPKGITFRVRMDDGTELPAEFVSMDDKADIAIMHVTLGKPTPFIQIAADNPAQGAEALVLGYPAIGDFSDHVLQISKGTVKSVQLQEEHHVWFDLNTTHGNSGGPIVDRHGNLIAILTAGRTLYNMTITEGVGVKQIGDYLTRLGDKAPKVTIAPATGDESSQPLDSEKLTKQCRGATVLVLAVLNAGEKPEKTPGAGETPAPDDKGGDKGGDKPADGGGDGGGDQPAAPSPGGGRTGGGPTPKGAGGR